MADHHSRDRGLGNEYRELVDTKLGATGNFPLGRYGSHDEGELRLGIALDPDNRRILVDFGKPVRSLGMGAENAQEIGKALLEKARQLRELP